MRVRFFLFACSFAIAGALGSGVARAAIETCPAHVLTVAPMDASHQVYALALDAPSARNFSGTVALWTGSTFYTVAIPTVAVNLAVPADSLVPVMAHPLRSTATPAPDAQSIWRDYESVNYRTVWMYVRLPQAAPIRLGWVYSGHADVSDWSGIPSFACYPPPSQRPSIRFTDPVPPVPAAATLATTVAPALESTSCAQPFADATAKKIAPFNYPEHFGALAGTTVAMVTIMPDGSAADATVVQSSGQTAFDATATQAALGTTYTAPISFCKPTVGQYLFLVHYHN